jgi:hypothetical protein
VASLRDQLPIADDKLVGRELGVTVAIERAELRLAHADDGRLTFADHTVLVGIRVGKDLARETEGVRRSPRGGGGSLPGAGCSGTVGGCVRC